MKRDMDLVRLILLEIEMKYVSTALYDLIIPGYSKEQVAYHCKILHDHGMISAYQGFYASNELESFGVGGLTWEGNDFLDKIRDDSQWGKIKETITRKGVTLVIETIRKVADAFISASVEGLTTAILKQKGIQ